MHRATLSLTVGFLLSLVGCDKPSETPAPQAGTAGGAVVAPPSAPGTQPATAPGANTPPDAAALDGSTPPAVRLGRVQSPEKANPGDIVRVTESYENGQLATERSERVEADGKFTRVGPMRAWFENGQLRCEGGYDEAGRLTGHWRYWDEAGLLQREGDFASGLREGDWVDFHPNGQKRSQGFLHVGLNEGPWKYWHENGQLAAEGTYVNNRRDGPWMFFDERGAPDAVRTGVYEDNVKVR